VTFYSSVRYGRAFVISVYTCTCSYIIADVQCNLRSLQLGSDKILYGKRSQKVWTANLSLLNPLQEFLKSNALIFLTGNILRDLRFTWRCLRRFRYPAIFDRICRYTGTNVSQELAASFFRVV
jgi:hypothetical protein